MGEGGGGEEKGSSSLPFSLLSFPFSPETPDTQAKRCPSYRESKKAGTNSKCPFYRDVR